MKNKLKFSTGILMLIGLIATYVACSESSLESSLTASNNSSLGVSLKTAVCTCASCIGYDSAYTVFSRDPDCSAFICGGGSYPAHQIIGLFFSDASTSVSQTDVACGDAINTGSGTYHMYFYNEKGYNSCGSDTSSGMAMLFIDTAKVQAYYLGKGDSVFELYHCISASCTLDWITDSFAYDLPYSANYRCGDTCTGVMTRSSITAISNTCIMGNDIQNTSDDYGPSDQSVYLLKIQDDPMNPPYYYVFMVYKFMSGTSGTLKKSMTIKYRLLETCD